jgi:hypothetical protein
VDAQTVRDEGEEGTLVQQALQVEVGTLADRLQLEAIGLADDAKCLLWN